MYSHTVWKIHVFSSYPQIVAAISIGNGKTLRAQLMPLNDVTIYRLSSGNSDPRIGLEPIIIVADYIYIVPSRACVYVHESLPVVAFTRRLMFMLAASINRRADNDERNDEGGSGGRRTRRGSVQGGIHKNLFTNN